MSKMTDSEAAEVLNVMFQFCANDRQMTEADALAKAIARLREPAGVAVGWPKRDAWGNLDFDHAGDKPTDADHASLAEGESFVPVYLAPQPPAEAQAQGGGEVVWAVVSNKSGEILNVFHGTREKWLADTKYWPEHGFRTRPLVYGDTAPPSAPVGVEGLLDCLPLEVRSANGYDAAWVAGFNEGVLQSRQNLQRTLAQRAAVGVSPPSGVAWHPIETAPKDNKHPLYLAQFNPDTGELIELDWDASWEAESESWEIPQVYYIWRSANGRVEEPTHWAYQNALAQQPAAVDGVMQAWISDNDLLKLGESIDEARNIRVSKKRTHLRVHPIYIPALAQRQGDNT